MKRKIIEINQEKCNGCGLCVDACHEGALQMVDGKAVLVSDEYCDGLGDCLPECPTDAIRIIERKAEPFDEESVKQRQAELQTLKEKASQQKKSNQTDAKPVPCGCPGTRAAMFKKNENQAAAEADMPEDGNKGEQPSELAQWPIQINLVNPNASFLKDADLLIAADCTAFAYGAFHRDFMKNKITMIGCPKLDDNQYYTEKITDMLKNNSPKSITVARMTVPCCSGIVQSVKQAMLNSQTIIPYREVIISPEGEIIN